MLHLDAKSYRAFLDDPYVGERAAADALTLVIVHATEADLPRPGILPIVVAAVGSRLGAPGPDGADVVVSERELDHLIETVERFPVASTSLAILLRYIESLSPEAGIAAESATYSTLQSGSEFAQWRAAGDSVLLEQETAAVIVDRGGDRVTITLNRPHRHNAISRQMRDELCAALRLAVADETILQVHLVGAGPSFCSGGDLAEFGARTDPADAHRVRLAQSPAHLLERLRTRTTAHIHGCTLGGGIEVAAFAQRVVADPETTIGLPEVRMGLIPGAGGTVSISRRAGRQRVAALALATESIDTSTALEWGLVDDVAAHP